MMAHITSHLPFAKGGDHNIAHVAVVKMHDSATVHQQNMKEQKPL